MDEKMNNNNIYITKDKFLAPFLLTQSGVDFLGTEEKESLIYFRFSPFLKCQKLVDSFVSYKAPLVQPKTLLDAVETFRDRIFEMRRKF